MNTEIYYTQTENGAIQFNSTGSKCLDLFASIGSCRAMAKSNPDILIKKFWEAYLENPVQAVSILFWVRAVREGSGERKIFEVLIKEVCDQFPNFIIDNLEVIVNLGRWKDLAYIYKISNNEIKKEIINFWASKIATSTIYGKICSSDYKTPDSLACKWLPKNSELYRKVQERLGFTNKCMRKHIAEFSKTVEQKMCANQWSEIDYSKIPSQALNQYKNAFIRNDREHFLDDIQNKGVNIGAIYPHEILWNYAKYDYTSQLNEAVEIMWRCMPNFINPKMRFIPVIDCSGSMDCKVGKFTAMAIARALGIYCAEHLEGDWKDKAILFSSQPQFIDLTMCTTLLKKNNKVAEFSDYSTTNIVATFELILEAAKNCKDKSTIPSTVLIMSDMQFDPHMMDYDVAIMDLLRSQYKKAGIEFPNIIYWNLCETNTGFADSQYDNVAFVSGFNPKILKAVFEGTKIEKQDEKVKIKLDPIKVMTTAIENITKMINFKNLNLNIPKSLKGIQLNTTIGTSIRVKNNIDENSSFIDHIVNLAN